MLIDYTEAEVCVEFCANATGTRAPRQILYNNRVPSFEYFCQHVTFKFRIAYGDLRPNKHVHKAGASIG